ncbi:hypothetical protein ACFUJR_20765 [Streptomyces sp. NPDC057271]|uniref:hypothetical protein n=1 Tax=unclassified Streptomyces TaxID=2593676 RepID=UPI003642556E
MKPRRRRTPAQPAHAPQAAVDPTPAPTAAPDLLARLAALEGAVSAAAEAQDLTPAGRHNAKVRKEQARTTRPAGPGPVAHCPLCGTRESPTGWRLAEETRTGWCCTECANVIEPPYIRGARRIPHPSHVTSLLASSFLGIEPVWWLTTFGSRYGLTWHLATDPTAGARGQQLAPGATGVPWSHVKDLPHWRMLARLAERRLATGMGALPPVDWGAYMAGPETRWVRRYDPKLGYAGPEPVQVPRTGENPNTPERLAAEAAVVEELLKAKRRQAKEAEAAAAEKARQADIRRHYREHEARLEAEIREHRAALRRDLRKALGKETA